MFQCKLNKFNRRLFIANRFSFKITRTGVTLPRLSISRTPFQDGSQSGWVQKVYVLERVVCKIDKITRYTSGASHHSNILQGDKGFSVFLFSSGRRRLKWAAPHFVLFVCLFFMSLIKHPYEKLRR